MTAPTMTGIGTIPITMTEAVDLKSMRHEYKYRISLQEDLVLSGRLRRLFARDAHAGPDGSYRITSLYFDTPYDRALREKLDGVDRREKFRLRYYGRDPAWLKLEKKYKINGLCGKSSARLSREEAERILTGDAEFLSCREEPVLRELYSKMQGCGLVPRTVVCYEREAFLYAPGRVRITLDRDLRTGIGPLDFLRPERLCLRPLEGLTILEIKYDEFLPDLVRMAVRVPDRMAGACSKYALCRRLD